jgi:hypothetical protein
MRWDMGSKIPINIARDISGTKVLVFSSTGMFEKVLCNLDGKGLSLNLNGQVG